MEIRIRSGEMNWQATLEDTPTGQALKEQLPLEGSARRWGDEIYFPVPVEAAAEPEATEVVPEGSLAYWPEGKAFCIFFGPTPASQGDEIRAAGPVNPVGRVIAGELAQFREVDDGDPVVIEPA